MAMARTTMPPITLTFSRIHSMPTIIPGCEVC